MKKIIIGLSLGIFISVMVFSIVGTLVMWNKVQIHQKALEEIVGYITNNAGVPAKVAPTTK